MRRELPLVSISMTAYNSAAWLPRAIESVLQQRTSFVTELVIGDDSSTDGTRDVLLRYQANYPDQIRVLDRPEKLGMQRNYYDVFEHCKGRYIAWLDADDYWTDPHKLSVQVNLLEADPTVSACGHFVRQVHSAGKVVAPRCPAMPAGRYRLADIVASNFVPSPSIVFRNGVHRSLPDAFFALTGLVDWPIMLQSALVGDIVLLDQIMADYVLTPGSAYQDKGPLYQDAIDLEFYELLSATLPQEWQRSIRAAKGKRYEAMSYHLLQSGNFTKAREAALQALRLPHPMDNFFGKVKGLVSATILANVRKRGKDHATS